MMMMMSSASRRLFIDGGISRSCNHLLRNNRHHYRLPEPRPALQLQRRSLSTKSSSSSSSGSSGLPQDDGTGTGTTTTTATTNGPPVADFRPRRIILLRHGQSLGNVDESAYVSTADWQIPLTDVGREQARVAGKMLRDKICEDDASVVFYYSPYLRTHQTLDEIMPYFDEEREVASCLEEPRLAEQQIGNFQNVQQVLDAKAERSKFGRFFYRFPSGEAGLDVYSRVSSFIPTLVRDCTRFEMEGCELDNLNVVIVTHGLALRFFLMRWFQWSVRDFELSRNPENCELITMNKMRDGRGHAWMELEEKDRVSLDLPGTCGIPRNVQVHQLRGVEVSSSDERGTD